MAYDFKSVEEWVLNYWRDKRIFKRLKRLVKNKPKFFLLDGPPYATGDPHPGTAINRGLKDLVRRYKWMQGFNVWSQPGFDMHGLPIESQVEKKFGLKNKSEIISFGVKRFIDECRSYATQYVGVMGSVFERLGEWADWSNPYLTIDNDYIEGVWFALKRIWERKALYEGSRVLTWCPHCGTALAANYEITHKTIREPSIYVKFKVKGEPNTYLIVWTTTPWTLTSNMAVMVNPDITYVHVKTGDEVWIIAKDLVASVMGLAERDFRIIDEFKGSELEGLSYEHLFFNEIPYHQKPHGKNAYTVVLSKDYVNLGSGTGLVHCAPGCGPEDQEVGNKYHIPSFNPIDENGVFTSDGGVFEGLRAKTDDAEFIKAVKDKGLLVAEEIIEHEYPHCERCKSPVVFKNTKQWFIKVTKFKNKMVSENDKVYWVPKWAGASQFRNWLLGVRDWCITRQRFWGIPLPVWQCDKCGKVVVIGSVSELRELAGRVPRDLHKPAIDSVSWKCSCGGSFHRNPDVIDVWIDSACAPFASLPQPRDEWIKRLGKMDFIVEAKDQIRGWFYSLMGIGVSAFGECPYKSVFMHGYLNDEKGFKLSKRKGNYMSMNEIFNRIGADVFRSSLMSSLTPGVDSKFIMSEVENTYKLLNVIWSTHDFIKRNIDFFKINDSSFKPESPLDEWLLSRLNSLIRDINELMDKYLLHEYAPRVIDFLVEDLSRFYIKLVRNKLNPNRVKLIKHAYITAIRLFGPVAPFISEYVYLKLGGKDSLFLNGLPVSDESLINDELEREVVELRRLITLTLAAREKAGLSVRWPVREVLVNSFPERFKDLFLEFVNAKELRIINGLPGGVSVEFKPDFSSIKKGFGDVLAGKIIPKLLTLSKQSIANSLLSNGFVRVVIDGEDTLLTESNFIRVEDLPDGLSGGNGVYITTTLDDELVAEGYAREVVRRVQEGRKALKLVKSDLITLSITSVNEFIDLIKPFSDYIKRVTGASLIVFKKIKGDFSKSYRVRDYEFTISIKH